MTDVNNRIVQPHQGNQNLNNVNNQVPVQNGNVPAGLRNAQVGNAGNSRIVPQGANQALGQQNLANAQQVNNPAPMVNQKKNGAYIASVLQSKKFKLSMLPDSFSRLIKDTISSAKEEHVRRRNLFKCSDSELKEFLGEGLFSQFIDEIKNLPEEGLLDIMSSILGKYSQKAVANAEVSFFVDELSDKNKQHLGVKDIPRVVRDLQKNEDFSKDLKNCFTKAQFDELFTKHLNLINEKNAYYDSLKASVNVFKEKAILQLSELTGIPLEVLKNSCELKSLTAKLEVEQILYHAGEKQGNFEDSFNNLVRDFVDSKNQLLQDLKQSGLSQEKTTQLTMLLIEHDLPEGVTLDSVLSHGQGGIGALLNSSVNPPEGFTKPSAAQLQEELKKTCNIIDSMYQQDLGEGKWKELTKEQQSLLRDLTTLVMFDKTPGLEAGLAVNNDLVSAFNKMADAPEKHLFEQALQNSGANLIALLDKDESDKMPVALKIGIMTAFEEVTKLFGENSLKKASPLMFYDQILNKNLAVKLKEKLQAKSVAANGQNQNVLYDNLSIHDIAKELILESLKNNTLRDTVLDICKEQHNLTLSSLPTDERLKNEMISKLNSLKNFTPDLQKLNSKTEIENYIKHNEQCLQEISLIVQTHLAARNTFNNIFEAMIAAQNISDISRTRIYKANFDAYDETRKTLLDAYINLPAQERPAVDSDEFKAFIEDKLGQIISPRVEDLELLNKSGLSETQKVKYTDMILAGKQPDQFGTVLKFATQFAHLYDPKALQVILEPVTHGKTVNETKLLKALSEFEKTLINALPPQLDLNGANLTDAQKNQLSLIKDMVRQQIFNENPEFGQLMAQIPVATLSKLNESNKELLSLVNTGRAVYASKWMSQERCDAIRNGHELSNRNLELVLKHGPTLFDTFKKDLDPKLHYFLRQFIGSVCFTEHSLDKIENELRKLLKHSKHWKEFTFDTCPPGLKAYLKNAYKGMLDECMNPDFKDHTNYFNNVFGRDVCRSAVTLQGNTYYYSDAKDFDPLLTKILLKGRNLDDLSPQEKLRLNKQKLGITTLLHQGTYAVGHFTLFQTRFNENVDGANVIINTEEGLQFGNGSLSDIGIELSEDGKSCILTYRRKHEINGSSMSRDYNGNAIPAADNVEFCYRINLNFEGDEPEISDASLYQLFAGSTEKKY